MTKDNLVTWLGEAYALEQQLIETLEKRLDQARDFPDMSEKYEEHLNQTRKHADLVKSRLDAMGESVPVMKNALAHMMGGMAGLTDVASDTLVRNAVADYTTEHMEIVSYTAIAEGARTLGDDETAEMAESILEDEQAMAAWVYDQLPTLTHQTPAMQR